MTQHYYDTVQGDYIKDIFSKFSKQEQDILAVLFGKGWDKDTVCRTFLVDHDYLRVLLHRAKLRFAEAEGESVFQPRLFSDNISSELRSHISEEKRIVRPPGSLLSSLSEFLCSPKTVRFVVNPIIAELQAEYCDALAAKRRTKAAWVRIRGYWSFWKAMGLYSVMKIVVDMWRKVSS
jgi:hypothetical protein